MNSGILKSKISIVVYAAIVLLIMSSGAFATATITQTASVPLTIVDFDTDVTVPQFDPSLGELLSIQFILDGHVEGNIQVENQSGEPVDITATIAAALHLHNPSHADIVVINASTAKNYSLTAFDGAIDFGGTSGVTDIGVAADDSGSATMTIADPDFPLFIGAGTVTLPVHSVGSSNVTGSASLVTALLTQASAVVTVIYTYGVPAIDIEKLTNGEDADTPPGPSIPVGDPVVWTYIVTNIGETTLIDVVVTDDILGVIGTIPSLAPGESATLTANGTAVAGQYANVGTATDGNVSDTDPSHYFGEQPTGNEGLTPGYWKNHPEAWVGYTTDQLVGSVFIIPASLSDLADDTLMEALSYKGDNTIEGAAKILLRAAVAALLNASSPDVDYPVTEAQIIAAVNDALASGDRDTILELKDILDYFNNLGNS